jgi:hypothetical protein
VPFLRFLKALVKTENAVIQHVQNLIMDSFSSVTENVLLFYNDDLSFQRLGLCLYVIDIKEDGMRDKNRNVHASVAYLRISYSNVVLVVLMQDEELLAQETNDMLYHIELVSLLALCCVGMNVYAEIRCQVI